MQISQVMTSILIKYDEQEYLSQFIPEMLDFCYTPQYALNVFVTMATY